jgi:hypothetical protein
MHITKPKKVRVDQNISELSMLYSCQLRNTLKKDADGSSNKGNKPNKMGSLM